MASLDSCERTATCELCNIVCTPALNLFAHLVGRKHRDTARLVSPKFKPYSLQYIFDTYLKEEPLVGLEYITERGKESRFIYQCLLCGFQGRTTPTFEHIIGQNHIEKYLKKVHPRLPLMHGKYKKSLQLAVSEVCKRFGRKVIRRIDGLPQKMPKSDPKTKSNVTPDINRETHPNSAQNLEQKGSDHPAASDKRFGRKTMIEVNADGSHGPTPPKMSKSFSDPKAESNVTPDIIRDVHTSSLQNLEQKGSHHPAEVLAFTGNGEFLDFLQKFEIRSEEDAWFIGKIIENCAQELERFQEEQTLQNQVLGAPSALANETGKGSWVSATGAGKVAPALELQTNSIKNMEGSEVGTILQEMEKLLQLTRPSE